MHVILYQVFAYPYVAEVPHNPMLHFFYCKAQNVFFHFMKCFCFISFCLPLKNWPQTEVGISMEYAGAILAPFKDLAEEGLAFPCRVKPLARKCQEITVLSDQNGKVWGLFLPCSIVWSMVLSLGCSEPTGFSEIALPGHGNMLTRNMTAANSFYTVL